MIARVWRGRVRAADLPGYCRYVTATGLADYRATPGNRGAQMLTRIDGDVAQIITLSFWDGLDSIRAFAGENAGLARYYPDDDRFLLEFPEHVEHYDVFE